MWPPLTKERRGDGEERSGLAGNGRGWRCAEWPSPTRSSPLVSSSSRCRRRPPALPAGLSYRLELEDLGAWRVESRGDRAEVSEVDGGGELNGEAFAISTDAGTLARLAAGGSPIGALARGRLKLRGKRRKALALRGLSQDAGPRDLAKLGLPVDPDLLFRSLAYAIDPEWTRGHRFRVAYELVGDGGGQWHVDVDDGEVRTNRGLGDEPDALVRIRLSDWLRMLSGDLTPSESMRLGLTEIEGRIPPVTRLGRWIDRAEGIDGPELEREQRQRRPAGRERGALGEPRPERQCKRRRRGRRRPRRDEAAPRRPDELRAALRALGASELARPRARLLGRQAALAGHARPRPSSTPPSASAASTSARSG